MVSGRRQLTALLAGASLALCACSASSSGGAPRSTGSPPPQPSQSTGPSATGGSGVQTYVDAVNGLCDDLLPKVIAVTHGGSLDIPVKKYLAQQPAHAKLLADFDRKLNRVPVPPAAQGKAAAFAAYVRFADRLDTKRLAAAKHGEAAYAKEIESESSIESDPSIAKLHAAGFGQSCEAR